MRPVDASPRFLLGPHMRRKGFIKSAGQADSGVAAMPQCKINSL
jgi:hypothetical protein